jgi:branched-chain amino acid transport system substrate-binding protein
MRALHLIINVCLVFSLQILLAGSLSGHQTLTGSLSDPQSRHAGLLICDSPFEGGQGEVNTKNQIKIGLLIQTETSVEAKNGAELAILIANRKGGYKGFKFDLVVRSMEGPWGTGSKQAVKMIFDENVIAILGSHDGRNAHLVEQVTAKSGVVFLSAWSSDPTLSQAFVPWFFNCVPNDLQQADALIEEIYNRRKLTKTAVVSDNSYDSQSALRNFLKKVTMEGKPEPLQLSYDSTGKNIIDLPEELIRADISCVVLLVKPPSSVKIAEQIQLKHLKLPVFGSLAFLDENHIADKDIQAYKNVIFISSVDLSGSKGISFREEYTKTYGNLPGAVAAYAFDGMNILIEAIGKAGTNRENIQKAMAAIKYEGVTGVIQFDDKGNRKGTPGFAEIKNGIPVIP